MKQQFIKLTVYLFNAPDDIALDQQQIEEILFAFANSSKPTFLTEEMAAGDHIANYCDLCNIRNLTYNKAERYFNEVFEPVTDQREYTEFIPLENQQSC